MFIKPPANASIIEHFSSIPGPRLNRRKLHKLGDVFFITLCAAICGANDWVAIEAFGKAKKSWFDELLDLENGIPSHDTFGNVFAAINTQKFSECFSRWVVYLTELSGENIIKEQHPKWTDLKSIIAVTAKRECNDKITEETRYFISSLDATAPKYLGQVVRAHWGVENNLHWVLDYAFDEDSQRTRMGNSAANMAIFRHISLNLLKSEKTAKIGIKNKRLKARWDEDYLLKVLFSQRKK